MRYDRWDGTGGGDAAWLLILGEDCRPGPGFDDALATAEATWPNAAAFECRTLPNEQDHPLELATMETPFLAGGGFVVRREAFARAGGLNAALPFRWAAIELSLRLRAAGGKLYYLPGAEVWQDAATGAKTDDEYYLEGTLHRFLLGCRHGEPGAGRRYREALKNPRPFPGVRKALLRQYLRRGMGLGARLKGPKAPAPEGFWQALDFHRGAYALAQRVEAGPLVSIVVRTHSRPATLRQALDSIARQTYPNYEVVVIEDGADTARAMVEAEFARLPLRYHATGENAGRSKAGNLGLSMAKGAYLCFLDDDDYLYPEHLELLVAEALAHPEADLILGTALVERREEDEARTLRGREMIHFDRLDVFTMSQMCQIPIQSVLFRRELYEARGGLEEKLTAHEDWAMWLRYLSVARRAHPGAVDVHRATSVFVQTADAQKAAGRMAGYMENDAALFGDESIRFDVSLGDMRAFYDGMLADIRHVQQLGQLDEFLTREAYREQRRD